MRVTLMLCIIVDISGVRFSAFNMFSNKNRRYFYKGLKTPRPRVIQGQTANMDEHPYLMYVVSILGEEKDKICTGSLIAPTWVLTSSHCFRDSMKFVKCGNMSIPWEDTECKSEIFKKIMHPSYFNTEDDLTLMIDIGLLRIKQIESYESGVGRLHAADSKTFLGRAVRFAGFGMTYRGYEHSSKSDEYIAAEDETRELQTGVGVIFDVNDVLSIAPSCNNIRHTIYYGDSGGPVFVDGKIAGVAAGITDYTDIKHPEHSFYTPVSAHLDWIIQTIRRGRRKIQENDTDILEARD